MNPADVEGFKKRSRSSSEASSSSPAKTSSSSSASKKPLTGHKSKQDSKASKEPFLVNVVVNLLMTFALSLSIYLLIANVLLTVHKFSYQSSGSRFNFGGDRTPVPVSHESTFDRTGGGGGDSGGEKSASSGKKYYDCSTSILSVEECNQINMYHDEYLHLVKTALASGSALSSSSSNNHLGSGVGSSKSLKPIESNSNFKVNTSLYIR